MGKKGHKKESKKKLTKKEKKQQNHLRLVQGKKGNTNGNAGGEWSGENQKKSA